jgi:2-oxo-4-hydroxy-4-carboxy-5-ureidoimidazoline decarboxylase
MDASQRLDAATESDARAWLTRCCGSARWVDRMLHRRPFVSDEQLLAVARDEWFALTPDDWREAFRHHPRIGDRDALRARFSATADAATALPAREQQGVAGATDATLDALAEGNRAYEEKFGFIFIVCATGKSADQMLALLQQRIDNDADTELVAAAGEQAKITELRLLGLASR